MPSELSLFLSSIPKSKAPKTWIQKSNEPSDARSGSQKALRKRQRESHLTLPSETTEDSKKMKTTDSISIAAENSGEDTDFENDFVAAEIDEDLVMDSVSDGESEKTDDDHAPIDYYESRYNHPKDLEKKVADVKSKSYTSRTMQFKGSVLEKIAWHDLPSSLDWKPKPQTPSSIPIRELRQRNFIKERLGPELESLSSDQASLFECLHQYRDLLFTNSSIDFEEDLTTVCALHVLNHIYKARDRTTKNTLKIKTAVLESGDVL